MPKKSNKITINHWFYYTLKPLLRIWLQWTFNLEANIPEEVKNLKPPFLILPNHQGFWDPFMAGIYLKQQIFYIASDAIFRSPFFGLLMKLLGVIPKTKAQSDIDALKNIIRIKERGKVIGIFPEGRRTWDGATLPLVYSTSKLIRMLKIPVVVVVFKGGFFSQPRWGFHIQKGKVIMDYKILFRGDEVKSMKIESIHNKLAEALSFNEFEYQNKVSIKYKGRKPAEHLEQVLYTCPSCISIGTMFSRGNKFSCKKCNYELDYNQLGKFESSKNKVIFDNIRDWNLWQQKNLYSFMDDSILNEESVIEDNNLIFHTGYKSEKLYYLTFGSLHLARSSSTYFLIIKNSRGDEIKSFPFFELQGINIQNKERLEFYHQSTLYTIKGKYKRFSAYKWLKTLEYLVREKTSQFQAE
ncbi:MAG: lysophospholipid acyltransferase family protein [Spirochaetia bacterium]|jgi:1-acyl-sn-glycerol-3-phosphate acyltransferase|nr:lysophospholipid acyltransferase family protein [Spirochaetia bacterium]